MLKDRYGRIINTLRVSVTDRCNLRCIYCTIYDETIFLPKTEILTLEEIIKIIKIMAEMGVKHVKITGGEPLVRKNIAYLIHEISKIKGIIDISMTTNGTLLTDETAILLKRFGLNRMNISLDSLNPDTFKRITGGGNLKNVLEGIDNALKAGLYPVKINTVLIEGVNDSEIMEFLDFAAIKGITLRFIEEMPFGNSNIRGVSNDIVFSILKKYLKVERAVESSGEKDSIYYPGPSVTFRIKNSNGKIGFISPFSRPFCGRCNRVRLSADGFLLPCISRNDGINIKEMLRNDKSNDEIANEIKNAVLKKKFMHNMFTENIIMNRLGG